MDANGENEVRGRRITAQYLFCGVVVEMNSSGQFSFRGVIRSKSSPGILLWLLAMRE